MAHVGNACSKTQSDTEALKVSLEPKISDHHIGQLIEEDNLTSMLVSETIPASACLGDADPLQETDPDPQWKEDIKTNQQDITKNESSASETYLYGTEINSVLLASLDGYSDVSSCSGADIDCITSDLPDQSLENQKMGSTEETKEKFESNPSTLFHAGDNLHDTLKQNDKEAADSTVSDNREPPKSECDGGSDLKNVIDDGSLEVRSPFDPQDQNLIISSTEGENNYVLQSGANPDDEICKNQNSELDVEELNKDCKDTPASQISSVCAPDSSNENKPQEKNDINGGDAYEQSSCQFEDVRENKLDGQEIESNPDSKTDDKPAIDITARADHAEGQRSSVDEGVERSSFEFLHSCFGFKNTGNNPPSLSSLARAILEQQKERSSLPGGMSRISCEQVDQLGEVSDGVQEPPLLSASCKDQASSESGQQNICTEQMISGLAIETKTEVSLVSSQKLMRKLQPIVLVQTSEPKANEGNVYNCCTCKTNSQKLDELIEHHHSEHIQCNFQCCLMCGRYFSSAAVAEQHACWQFTTDRVKPRDRLPRHEKSKKPDPQYFCRYCLKPFILKSFYLEHEYKHRAITPHRCSCCGLYFELESKLRNHKRKVKCLPLIKQPSEESEESPITPLKKAIEPDLHGDDDCEIQDCFVKLVDINEDNHLPQKIKCRVCGKTFRLRAQLRAHLRTHREDKLFKCNSCKKTFRYSWNLNKHKKEQCFQSAVQHHESPESLGSKSTKFQCPLCTRVFKYHYNRARHLREQCLKEYTRKGKGKVGNRYTCPLCTETFSMACNRNRHIKKVCFQKYKAKRIPDDMVDDFEIETSACDLKADVNEDKEERDPQSQGTSSEGSRTTFSCRFCDRCFSSSETLKKHLRAHVGTKPFRCLECGKNFGRRGHLIAHKSIHKRKIHCSVCKEILPSIGDLLKHRQSHGRKGKLECPECQMQFKFPVFLLRHVATHRNKSKSSSVQSPPEQQPKEERKIKIPGDFKCGVCQKRFVSYKALSDHCLTYLPPAPDVKCQLCERHLQSRAILIRHMRLHTGEKPFVCRDCGRRFSRKEYVKIHKEKCPGPSTVEGRKVYNCSYCPHVFSMSSSLKIHERAHGAKSLVPCEKCEKCYRSRNIKEHLKNCKASEPHPTFRERKNRNENEVNDSVVRNRLCKASNSGATIQGKPQQRCPHCSKHFQYRSYLLRHIASHLRTKKYACVHCGQKFDNKPLHLQHEAACKEQTAVPDESQKTKAMSSENVELKCKFCTKTFAKPRNLRRHILTHTDVKPYQCKACEKSFSRYDHLKLHQAHCRGKKKQLEVHIEKINLEILASAWATKTEQPNDVFECKICSKQFSSASNLTRHNAMLHTAFKPFSCKRCGKGYSSKRTLRRHVLTVNCKRPSGESLKPPVPNALIQPCRETSKLLQRIKGHYSNKFQFSCEYCPRFFKNTHQLRVHTRLHTGEKPFECSRCGESFIRKDYLLRHELKCDLEVERLHEVLCDRCGGLFTRNELHKHQKSCVVKSREPIPEESTLASPSKVKGFTCVSCNDHFLLFSELQEHFLSKHRSQGRSQSDNLDCRKSVIKEEPLQEGHLESLSSSNEVNVHQNTNGEKEKTHECPHCKMRFINRGGLSMHIRTHTADYLLFCSKCSKGFWSKTLMLKHKRRCKGLKIHPKKEPDPECAVSSELELNDTVLVIKKGSTTTGTGVLQTNFSCKDHEKEMDKEDAVVHKYQCSECDQSFTDGLRLISHLEDHGREDLERRLGKKHKCQLCGKTFDQAGLLQRHMKTQHSQILPNTCPQCFRKFRSPSDMELHRLCHDPNRPAVCSICQLRFWTPKALRLHRRFAHQVTDPVKASETSEVRPPKTFACHPCNKTYSTRKSYMRHCKNKHQGRSESREDKSAPKDQPLDKDHPSDKNESDVSDAGEAGSGDDSDSAPYFPCHVCGKTFVTSERLEDHQRCHLGEKPYECEECGKCFFQLLNLQQHQRSHKTEFQCHLCGKGFISLFALRKHKHTHVTKRPHRCTKCHLCFTGSSQLAEHMITHRDENFPCDLCHKTFTSKSGRAEHRKTHDEEEIPPLIPPSKQPSPPPPSEPQPQTVSSSSPNNSYHHFRYRCGICQLRFRDPEQLSEHGCRPAKERPYSCTECNKHFLHGSHLKKHQLSHQVSGPCSFQCKDCHIQFKQRSQYLNHLRRHCKKSPNSELQEEVPLSDTNDLNEDKIYKCPICPESFAQALELADHLSVHSHMCKVCKKTFSTKQQLEEHEHCHVSPATQYECTECGKSFLGSDSFRQHNCARQKRSLSDAQLGHSSKSPPRKKSSSGASFEIVVEEVQEEEEEEVDVGEDFYICPVCKKRFSSSSSLQEHEKLHVERPFPCLVCFKGFTKKRYLTQHQQLHSERPYRCEVCPEAFKTESNLLSHSRTHDATRIHQCSVCNKSYRTSSELSKHAKKHPELQNLKEASKDYRCDMCYKSFSLLSQLQKHQETHVGQVVYECTECEKAFAFLNLLEEHQKTHAASPEVARSPSHVLFRSPVNE